MISLPFKQWGFSPSWWRLVSIQVMVESKGSRPPPHPSPTKCYLGPQYWHDLILLSGWFVFSPASCQFGGKPAGVSIHSTCCSPSDPILWLCIPTPPNCPLCLPQSTFNNDPQESLVITDIAPFLLLGWLIPTDFDPVPAGDGLVFEEILLLACLVVECAESNCSKSEKAILLALRANFLRLFARLAQFLSRFFNLHLQATRRHSLTTKYLSNNIVLVHSVSANEKLQFTFTKEKRWMR